MVLFLQLCLLIITLRFPAWLIMNRYEMLKEKMALLKTISKTYKSKGSEEDAHSRGDATNWKQVVCASLATERLDQEHKVRNLYKTWFVIKVCFYCYVEGIDAFTLIVEILQKGDYFASHRALTYALLFFISVSLIITGTANLLQLLPEVSNWVSLITRLTFVVLSNLPLFILRIYMFVVIEQITGTDVVFVLFTIKEVVLLLLAVAYTILEAMNAKMMDEADGDDIMPAFCRDKDGCGMGRVNSLKNQEPISRKTIVTVQ